VPQTKPSWEDLMKAVLILTSLALAPGAQAACVQTGSVVDCSGVSTPEQEASRQAYFKERGTAARLAAYPRALAENSLCHATDRYVARGIPLLKLMSGRTKAEVRLIFDCMQRHDPAPKWALLNEDGEFVVD
jgi:hypothetical protein